VVEDLNACQAGVVGEALTPGVSLQTEMKEEALEEGACQSGLLGCTGSCLQLCPASEGVEEEVVLKEPFLHPV